MKLKNLKQIVSLNCSPKEAYETIMDSKKHGKLIGGKVSISKKPKGKFVVYDGYCHGYNIELTEGKKIIQAWHFDESEWPADHFSEYTFLFEKHGKGCKLTFTQKGIPEAHFKALKEGWHTYYWGPLKEMFKS